MVTLEGNKYCVTGTTKSFYVNSSTGNILDPRPNKAASEASTLIGLLQKISPKFKKGNKHMAISDQPNIFISNVIFILIVMNYLLCLMSLKLFVKFWSARLLHIPLKMFNLCCHQIRGLACILFRVSPNVTAVYGCYSS